MNDSRPTVGRLSADSFLGELFFTFSDHISSKISKSVNIIAKLKPHVASQSLINIYYAIVYPYLTYGCVLWGNNYEAAIITIGEITKQSC